jgi:hypothetical protein
MSAPVTSNAGRYGVSCATLLRGARIHLSARNGLRGSSTPL